MASLRDPLDLDFSDLDPNGGSYADRAARARAAGAKPGPGPDYFNDQSGGARASYDYTTNPGATSSRAGGSTPPPADFDELGAKPGAAAGMRRTASGFGRSALNTGRAAVSGIGRFARGAGAAALLGAEGLHTYRDVNTPGMTPSEKALRVTEGAGRVATTLEGGELGAAAGTAIGGPIGTVVGGLGGAALGYFAPEGLRDVYNFVGRTTGLYKPDFKLPSDIAAADRAAHSGPSKDISLSDLITGNYSHVNGGPSSTTDGHSTITTPSINAGAPASPTTLTPEQSTITRTIGPNGIPEFEGHGTQPGFQYVGDTRGLRAGAGTVSTLPASAFTGPSPADTRAVNAAMEAAAARGDFDAIERAQNGGNLPLTEQLQQARDAISNATTKGELLRAQAQYNAVANEYTTQQNNAAKIAAARYGLLPKFAQLRIDELKADQAQRNSDRSFKLQQRAAQGKTNTSLITANLGQTVNGKLTPESQADISQFRSMLQRALAPTGKQISDLNAGELQNWLGVYQQWKREGADAKTLIARFQQLLHMRPTFRRSSNLRDALPTSITRGATGVFINTPQGQTPVSAITGAGYLNPFGVGDPQIERQLQKELMNIRAGGLRRQ